MVLAGGGGTRLWPLARDRRPKQFLRLIGRRSLFERTLARARALAPSRRIIIVGAARHRALIHAQAAGLDRSQLILEEMGRDTAASIAIAALRIRAARGDGVMIVLPADHWIAAQAEFAKTIRSVASRARRSDDLHIIGVPPRSADSGFGYILPSGETRRGPFRKVASFVEKPPPAKAARMVRSGRYLWNSGIFVWRASAILRELKKHRPKVLRTAAAWVDRAGRGRWRVPSRVMRRIESVPIDRAVLERSHSVWVRRADFGWTDLGTWSALADLLGSTGGRNVSLGPGRFIDSSGCLSVGGEGPAVMLGLRDIIAVRDGDTLLVCHREAAQKVREVARRIAASEARSAS